MGKARELIFELIGEEDTETYFNGDRIEIEGLRYNYIIERKRGYADIVRNRYQENPYMRDGRRDRRISSTDSGRIRAYNIDDAVASFIVAARTGNVNWKCGNIDVRLPSSMPPKDLGVLTFVRRGIETGLYAILMGVEKLKGLLVGDSLTETAVAIGIWWLLNILGAIAAVGLSPKDAEGIGILAAPLAAYFNFMILGAAPIYALILLIKYYFVWKHTWEVKMS